MPYTSPVPAAITALVSLFTTALSRSTSPAVQAILVHDGPEPDDVGETTGVYVGWTGWPQDAAQVDRVGAESRPAAAGPGTGGMGGNRDREQSTIHCAAQVLNQDGDIGAARALAAQARDACAGAVAANRTLAGAIQGSASVSATVWLQRRGGTGALVTAQFDIELDAFTTI